VKRRGIFSRIQASLAARIRSLRNGQALRTWGTPRIHQGILPITLANPGYAAHILNLYRCLHARGLPWRPAVAVTDCATAEQMKQKGIQALTLPNAPRGREVARWLSRDFKEITFTKLDLLLDCQRVFPGIHLLFIDGDVAIYQNPWPYLLSCLEDHPEVLCFGQCDEEARPRPGAHRECPNLCSGFLLIRAPWPKRYPLIFNHGWHRRRSLLDYDCDQHFLNDVIQKNRIPTLAFDRTLVPNGAFLQNGISSSALLLHYNYLIGPQKEQAMRARGDWLEESAIPDSP